MIGYTLLGVRDLEQATAIYGELLGELGAQQIPATDRINLWSTGEGAAFGICLPADGNVATNGNGTMIALPAGSDERVDAILERAKQIGFPEVEDAHRNEGFYGGYLRDFDRNKLCIFHISGPLGDE